MHLCVDGHSDSRPSILCEKKKLDIAQKLFKQFFHIWLDFKHCWLYHFISLFSEFAMEWNYSYMIILSNRSFLCALVFLSSVTSWLRNCVASNVQWNSIKVCMMGLFFYFVFVFCFCFLLLTAALHRGVCFSYTCCCFCMINYKLNVSRLLLI